MFSSVSFEACSLFVVELAMVVDLAVIYLGHLKTCNVMVEKYRAGSALSITPSVIRRRYCFDYEPHCSISRCLFRLIIRAAAEECLIDRRGDEKGREPVGASQQLVTTSRNVRPRFNNVVERHDSPAWRQ